MTPTLRLNGTQYSVLPASFGFSIIRWKKSIDDQTRSQPCSHWIVVQVDRAPLPSRTLLQQKKHALHSMEGGYLESKLCGFKEDRLILLVS
jgi:hypothetical protein